jgi:hypothetical protein
MAPPRPNVHHFPGEAAYWAGRADELAAWAWSRLVNRTDVWGGYYPGCGATRQTTHPRVARRGKVPLTRAVLERHFAARSTGDLVGLHTTSADNLSRWVAVDIDKHGDGGNDPLANLKAALAWYDALVRLGFRPLLTDSNGKGGFHLLTLFRTPVPTPRTLAFARWLVRDFAGYGLPAAPEIFPKQPRIDPGRYGNWLRLPGRHHTRPHWSKAWDGTRWLDGGAAIAFILACAGDAPGLIPAEVQEPPERPRVPNIPAPRRHSPLMSAWRAQRITAYIERLPAGLGEGQGRDDHGYRLACLLVRDLGLTDPEAQGWLEVWDGRNAVPKGPEQLRGLIENARRYGKHPVGGGEEGRR